MRETCLNGILELARQDARVVFVGSDLSPNTLAKMKEEFPERFLMEGVAEQNLVGVAAGLAMEGYIPYVNTIGTFITRRCYEQVAIDCCLHDLPVRLIGNGGGLIYAPLGPTHLALEDMAIMRALPNMTVVAPADKEEMRRLMPQTLDWPHPMYIRLGFGEPILDKEREFEIGTAVLDRPKQKDPCRWQHIAFVSTGMMTAICREAAEAVADLGYITSVVHVPTVAPLDVDTIIEHIRYAYAVVTVEEGFTVGGLGSAVLEALHDRMWITPPVLRLGVPHQFPDRYGIQQRDLLAYYGLTAELIAKKVNDFLRGGK